MQITPINVGVSVPAGAYTTILAIPTDGVSATINIKAFLQDLTKNTALRLAIVSNSYVAGAVPTIEQMIIPQDVTIGPAGSHVNGELEVKGYVMQPGQKLVAYSSAGFTTVHATGFLKTNYVTIPSAGPDVQNAINSAVSSILGSQITSAVNTAVQPAVNQAISNSTTVTDSVNTAVANALDGATPQIEAAALISVQANANTFTKGQSYTETDKGTVNTGTVSFNVAAGNVQKLTVGGPLILALSGWPAAGIFGEIMVELVNGGSTSIGMPAGVRYELASAQQPFLSFSDYLTAIGRSPAVLKSAGTDFLYYWSTDGGNTVHGKVL